MSAPVDVTAAREFLVAQFDPHVDTVAELGAGGWSRAFSFQVDGRELVARFGQYLEDFEQDRAAMAYAGPDLPVPAVLEIGEGLGGYYAISERYHGLFPETLDAAGWRRLLPAWLRGLDALRAYPVRSEVSWEEQLLGSLVDHPGGRVCGWRAVLAASSAYDALFAAGERRMRELLAVCPDASHLIHGDLLNRNVLVSEDATRLTAVFDWGCLRHGDFLYELALFTFWAPWFPALEALDIRSAATAHYARAGVAVPHFAERLRCYELHTGLEHMAYHAFTGRTAELRRVANRTAEILGAAD